MWSNFPVKKKEENELYKRQKKRKRASNQGQGVKYGRRNGHGHWADWAGLGCPYDVVDEILP